MKTLLLLIGLVIMTLLSRAQAPDVPATAGTSFGETITATGAVNVDQLPAIVGPGKDTVVKIRGKVVDVCKMMGCWLKMQSATGTVMVRMKDESFFVPLALTGKTIVAQGIASLKETPVEMLRHYAEDAGKSKSEVEAITEPAKELMVEATGVLVL